MKSLHPSFSYRRIPLLPAVVLLIASSLLGDYVLLDDGHLWSHAATHAHGLLAFLFIDAGLLAMIAVRGVWGIRIMSLWGAAQAVLMLGDILTAPQFQFSYLQFAEDLYGYWAFDALLATRLLQAAYAVFVIRFFCLKLA